MNGEQVTTDFGRTQANLTGRFSIPLDPGQMITENLLFMEVRRIGGFSDGRIQAFLNGVKIWDIEAKFGDIGPFRFDSSIDRDLVFQDGTVNLLEFKFFQGGFDGLNRWQATAQFIYNGNTEQPPSTPPVVETPVADLDPTEGDSPPFFDPGSFADILFGDTDKIIRTVAVVAVGIGLIIVVPPIARAVTATQKVRKVTAV